LTGAFRGAQPQSQLPNTIDPSPVKQEDRDTMPPLPSSTTQASRKRSRPSCSGPPQSATKRRLNTPSIALDDSDDDQVEELGPDSSILAKEREALVNKQREESSKVNKIGDLNCMICLEHFTNMSATHCGMLHHHLLAESKLMSILRPHLLSRMSNSGSRSQPEELGSQLWHMSSLSQAHQAEE
jgi:hypothetical protein